MSPKKTWDVIIERDTVVPMRDGVNLVTESLLPCDKWSPTGREATCCFTANPLQEGELRSNGALFRQARLSVGSAGLSWSLQIRG